MERMVSEPQKKFIRDLVIKQDLSSLSDAQREFLSDTSDSNLDRMTMKQGSDAIKALLALPLKVKQVEQPKPLIPSEETHLPVELETQPANEVEEVRAKGNEIETGYFFIVDPTDNTEKFFRVNKGKEGTKWENYRFVSVQASDFFYPVKSQAHREAILAEIDKDPVNAMNEYGLRLGRCGVCNRVLTDRDSRLRGIGPICAARLDATPSDDDLDLLSRLGLT